MHCNEKPLHVCDFNALEACTGELLSDLKCELLARDKNNGVTTENAKVFVSQKAIAIFMRQ